MKPLGNLFAVAIALISTGAWAQGINSGYIVLTCEVSVLPLDEGHSIVVWKGKGVTVSAPDKPWHMSRLECIAITEIMADKSSRTTGTIQIAMEISGLTEAGRIQRCKKLAMRLRALAASTRAGVKQAALFTQTYPASLNALASAVGKPMINA
jgi:hypothetical protein